MSKVWLITGSSRGLGRALADAVLADGQRLVATSRDPKDLSDLVETYGDRVRAVALDVTDPAAARDAVAVATSEFGRLDVLVNNAGYANVSSIEDIAEDDFRRQVETNFFGVVNVTRAALPVMHARRDGRIIQISSIGGRRTSVGVAAYQASKFAVNGFSEALSNEVAPLGIYVTIVEPGGFRTDWGGSSMRIGEVTKDYEPTVGKYVDMVRTHKDAVRGDPKKAAAAILRIASEPKPPMRLLLGSDAVFLAGLIAETRAAEDAEWRELSLSTDFDGMGDFADTPVAKLLAPRER